MTPRPILGSHARRALATACALFAASTTLADAATQAPVVAPAPAPQPPAAPVVSVVDEQISVMAGSSRLLSMPTRVETVVVGQPNVADAKPISPKDVVIVGKACGTTDIVRNMSASPQPKKTENWMTSNSGKCRLGQRL